jgi:hypothetical protein
MDLPVINEWNREVVHWHAIKRRLEHAAAAS